MATLLSEYLVTDDTTILLGLIAATVFLLNNLYKPQPLVHPILLGRQSDAARVRNPGESAVYRNYGTGLMGRVRLLHDLVGCCLKWFLAVPSKTGQGCAYSGRHAQTRLGCVPNVMVY
jgi:hypothetical protein